MEGERLQALVVADDLRTKLVSNLALSLCSVVYMSISIVCFILNGFDRKGGDPVITDEHFHELEFWATFFFNVVQVLALVSAPKVLVDSHFGVVFLKMVFLVQIGGSFISALLVTINLEWFEVPSHELEYTNEFSMAFVDLVLLTSQFRNIGGSSLENRAIARSDSSVLFLTVLSAILIAAVPLGIYNMLGSKGETFAHYFEFSFGIFSAGITFWFTMDAYYRTKARVDSVTQGLVGESTV